MEEKIKEEGETYIEWVIRFASNEKHRKSTLQKGGGNENENVLLEVGLQ